MVKKSFFIFKLKDAEGHDIITEINGKKVKELFALLVDKKGQPLQSEEAFHCLWEGEYYNNENASKYRKLWSRLMEFLKENNLEIKNIDYIKTEKILRLVKKL